MSIDPEEILNAEKQAHGIVLAVMFSMREEECDEPLICALMVATVIMEKQIEALREWVKREIAR